MSAHLIKNSPESRAWFSDLRQVGNSMSTKAQFDGEKWHVIWKEGRKSWSLSAPEGAQIHIFGGGEEPRVNIPPRDPVAQVAWEYRFYAQKRCRSMEEFRRRCDETTIYSVGHGCEMPAANIYRLGDRAAIAYKQAMEGQRGVPYLWFAGPDVAPNELQGLIDRALGQNPPP